MIWIYLVAAMFGGAFLIPMVLGGLDSGLDADFDTDLDADLDAGFDADIDTDVDLADIDTDVDGTVESADGPDLGGALSAVLASLLSFRTVVFFAAFFGASGLVFEALGYGTVPTAASAVLVGAIAAVANSLLVGMIRQTQSTSQIGDRTLVGRPGRVVLPMTGSAKGRIRVDLAGQPQFLVARSFTDDGSSFDVGDPVVVVSFEHGTALVASLAELDDGLDPA